jgi:HK97 family phage major capsid protein
MYATGTVAISLQVLQDNVVNIEGEVLDILSTALARGQNADFTNGAGTNQPQGVVTAASIGYTAPTGFTATIAWDHLVELYHAIDPAYRNMVSVRWMLNDATLKAIKKLKDTVGRPLWLPATASSVEPGSFEPDTILGKPYTINQDMPGLGANATPILFGAFEKYLIRDVMAAMILRFTDSAYARKLMVGFSGFMRSDGRMIDATGAAAASAVAIKAFQNSAT